MDFFPNSFVSVLLWSLEEMPSAFAEMFIVFLSTAFEGVFPLLIFICSIHANNILDIIQTFWRAGRGNKVFSPVEKDHGGLREKGYDTDFNALQQCQGRVSCMQKYKWACILLKSLPDH